MFIGHFALGLAGKRAAPALSLGTLFMAAQLLDLLWPTFLLLGIEQVQVAPGITPVTPLDFVSYPYSHSLAAALGWAALFGGVCWLWRRRAGNSLLLAGLVLSHWVLDWASHRPDLPLDFSGPARVGLGLWYSLPATLAVELLLLLAGALIYSRSTLPQDRAGHYGFWGLVVFLLVAYLAAVLGPPPTNAEMLGWGGQSVWLLVLWGFWVDRHRRAIRA
jgi:hypothetical protein